MTTREPDVTLATLSARLDGLTDLFRRRLLDDRSKQAVIEDLQARLTRAEKAASATSLKPLVDGISLVIERLQTAEPSEDLRTSIVDELEYVLESLGVTGVAARTGDPVDRLRHEVVAASGEGPELRVAELVRAGYEKDGVVLRPAKITAMWVPPTTALGCFGSGGDG